MSAPEDIWRRVESILAGGRPVALAVTGGGSLALSWLFNHPGASRVLLEAQIPYGAVALDGYLGTVGPHPATAETARALAAVAFWRARRQSGEDGALGLGCTAALATDRQRRGEDRAHLCVRGREGYRLWTLRFVKGAADRLQQEEVLSRQLVQGLDQVCGATTAADGPLPPWAAVDREAWPAWEGLEDLLAGRIDAAEAVGGAPPQRRLERAGRLLLPGSFNPLHEGHEGLAAVVAGISQRPAALEISVRNVDKPPLDYAEVRRRLEGIGGRLPAVLSRAPTFVEKARLFPGSVFAVGADTAMRLFEGRYYAAGEAGMHRALQEIAALGCRFLVAGRLVEGRFVTLDQISVPPAHAALFAPVPVELFRRDISSTQLRAKE